MKFVRELQTESRSSTQSTAGRRTPLGGIQTDNSHDHPMITLVQSGAFIPRIILAKEAGPAVRYAAEEFLRYINRMTQCYYSTAIADDASPVASSEIVIGDSVHRAQLFRDIDPAKLAREEIVVRTRGRHLLLLGGSPRATLYAVYELLERLGVRWWTAKVEHVPFSPRLDIPELNVRFTPPLSYRAEYYVEAMDADWQARLRLNAGTMTQQYLADRHGGMEHFAADKAGHTYAGLVPIDQYFDRHPEYFSEVNGVRQRHLNQLCCTHPDVADIAAATARRWLDATPDCRIVSATQNDHRNWCTCRNCQALIDREGAPSALVLNLANEIAKRLVKTHPQVLVDTFAYDWTLAAPRKMQAHPNVLVRLAPIWNCFGHSIRSCPANEPCRTAFAAWSRIAQHLFVWHYVTDFNQYLMPYPNLMSLRDDLQFYIEHGVKGAFYQGNGNSLGGDMSELKSYLIAKLLWNPQLDAAALCAEFLAGYYRAAAPAVAEYLAVFEKARGKEHAFTYASKNKSAPHREPAVLARAGQALGRARHLAHDDPEVLDRLELIQARLDYTGQRNIARALDVLERHGVTHYAEDAARATVAFLRRRWLFAPRKHPTITLRGGGSRLTVVPALGGRITVFGPARGRLNFMAQNSPAAQSYPYCIGYEEYSERQFQSAGYTEPYEVIARSAHELRLRARLDNGLLIDRRISLNPGTGAVHVDSVLRNPTGITVQADLRGHLEIDLGTPPDEVDGFKAGAWSGEERPMGWKFWSAKTRRGFWQSWTRRSVGATFLGSNPAEKTTLSLDLAVAEFDRPLAPGQTQRLRHSFGWMLTPD